VNKDLHIKGHRPRESAKVRFLPEVLCGQAKGVHSIVGQIGKEDGAWNSGQSGRGSRGELAAGTGAT